MTNPLPPIPAFPGSNRSALYRLILLTVGTAALVIWLHGFDVLVVVLALVVMVMVHEAGHFFTAKLSGMKVTEYFFGFGPKVLSFRRGETEYGVKAIPAGGYVKIVGMTALEEVHPQDEPRSYRQSTFPRRLLVGVAGSTMHFVMAFGLFWGIVAFAGLPLANAEVGGFTKFTNAASPAQAAGLRPGDVVVAVNGKAMPTQDDFVNYVRARPDTRLEIEVRRGGKFKDLAVVSGDGRRLDVLQKGVPTPEVSPKSHAVGVIGIELGSSYTTENPVIALGRAGSLLGSAFTTSFSGLGELFSFHGLASFAHSVASARSDHAKGNTGGSAAGNSGQLVSILGAIQIGSQAAHQNISELLYILAAVNVFVGIINLLPMLPLDGGHVAIAIYERVRSRRGHRYQADITKMMPVVYVFLAFLLVLGVGAFYSNLVNPVHLPGP